MYSSIYKIAIILVLITGTLTGCATNDSHCSTSTTVRLGNCARITEINFVSVDGNPAHGSQIVLPSTGNHLTQVAIEWPNGEREIQDFPINVKNPGSYYIDVMPFPKIDKTEREATKAVIKDFRRSDVIHNAAAAGPAGILVLGPAMALIGTVYTGETLMKTTGADERKSPLKTLRLSLRKGNKKGLQLAYKLYVNPEWEYVYAPECTNGPMENGEAFYAQN